MRRERTASVLAAIVALGVGVAWMSSTRPAGPPISQIRPGQFYAVDVQSERATLVLPLNDGERYLLIVGSLGDSGQTHTVDLQSQPYRPAVADAEVRLPAREVVWTVGSGERGAGADGTPATVPPAKTPILPHRSTSVPPAPALREFHLHVTEGDLNDAKQYARVSARLVAEGRQVRVYLDRQQSTAELAAGVTDEIVSLLDDEIMPDLARKLGRFADVDADGKFTVLLTPWLGHLQGGRTSLGGFVRGADFRTDLKPPFSNRCDMLYLNSNVRPGKHLRDLLAHEFTHVVCFSERQAMRQPGRALPDEEDWLNEAIAHLSERDASNVDYRVSRFLNATHDHPLVVPDYYQAGMWRNHGCRGATYLFLRWCADQYGDGLLARLVHQPARGTRNLEWATGCSFDELFRRWTMALATSGNTASGPAADNYCAVAEQEAGGFRSIDLRGRLDDWGLAGPRIETWDVAAGPQVVRLRGTAARFLELHSSDESPLVEIQLSASQGTELQLSLMKLPDDSPRIRIETEWVDAASRSTLLAGGASVLTPEGTTSNGAHHTLLSVRIVPEYGDRLSLERISCEQNFDEVKRSFCFSESSGQWAVGSGQSSTPAETRQTNDPVAARLAEAVLVALPQPAHAASHVLPLPTGRLLPGPLVLKVVMVDDAGRRSVAWSTLRHPAEPGGSEQWALSSGR